MLLTVRGEGEEKSWSYYDTGSVRYHHVCIVITQIAQQVVDEAYSHEARTLQFSLKDVWNVDRHNRLVADELPTQSRGYALTVLTWPIRSSCASGKCKF